MDDPISHNILASDITTDSHLTVPSMNTDTNTDTNIDTDTDTDTTNPQPTPHHHQKPTPKQSLTTLPPEIHLLILDHLPYPDALSLKLTSSHFHTLITPTLTVVTRVTWLLTRAQSSLTIPKSRTLKLHSDAAFVGNAEVKRILNARVRHEECARAWRAFVDERQNAATAAVGTDLYDDGNNGGDRGIGVGRRRRSRQRRKWPGCLVSPGIKACEKGMRVLDDMGFGLERRMVTATATATRRARGVGSMDGEGESEDEDEDEDEDTVLDVATRPRSLQRGQIRHLEQRGLLFDVSSSSVATTMGFLLGLAVLFGFLAVGLGGQWESIFFPSDLVDSFVFRG